VELAPDEMTQTTANSEPSAGVADTRRPWLVAAAIFAIAVLGMGWWVSRPETMPVDTAAPGDVPYRWTTEDSSGATAEGVVDPTTGWATMTFEPFGMIALTDGDAVAVQVTDAQAEFDEQVDPDRYYLVEGFFGAGDSEEFGLFFADRTRTRDLIEETFEVGPWEDLGRETVNEIEATHYRATASADFGEEVFITDSLVGFLELFNGWEGSIDVWVRNDGLVSRVHLDVNELNEQGEVAYEEWVQLDYFDVEGPTGLSWPDGAPPTEILPDG